MRLDFNVLWVEDQPARVHSYQQKIDRLIRKEGFRLETVFATSIDHARQYLGSDIYGDHIDLVVMDYDLGAGPTGEDGLLEVRNAFSYKDIVFYSAQVGNLTGIVARRELQGIYRSDREGLPDTVVGVFESLVKKVLDIDHARGIILGSSSDIDGLILDSLTAIFARDDDVLSAEAKQIVSDRLKDIKERFEQGLAAVAAAAKMSEIADLHHIYTSNDRLNLLRKVLEADGSHSDSCDSIKSYVTTTIPKRNLLAHVRVTRNGFSRKLIDKHGKEFTSGEMKAILQALLQHQEAFEQLVELIKRT